MRIDMVFSYWIFAWYLLYISKITNYNPKFLIILGLIENAVMLSMMILFHTKIVNIIWFIFINIILKVIPLYTLWNDKIKRQDILISIILFMVYLFYLYLHRVNFTTQQKRIINSLLYNQNKTPFLHFINKYLHFHK
jgi:hypothetical protein